MVYFIQAGGHGRPIKVGYSKNPSKRLKQLQTGCPYKLNLLFTIPGNKKKEAELHYQFRFLQYTGDEPLKGEWFIPDPMILCLKEDDSDDWVIGDTVYHQSTA